jgi:hypothetical protein
MNVVCPEIAISESDMHGRQTGDEQWMIRDRFPGLRGARQWEGT